MSASVERLRTEAPARLVPALAVPTVIGLVASVAYQFMNTFFVARIGVAAVAAVIVVFPVTLVVTAAASGLGQGLSSVVSRALGAGERDTTDAAARTGLIAGVTMGAVLAAVLGVALSVGGLRLLGVPGDVRDLAVAYAVPTLAGYAVMTVNILCGFLARAEGNTKFSMRTQLIAFLTNLVLDPLLIFGLDLGVAGAGMATLLAQLAAALAYRWYFRAGPGTIRPGSATTRLAVLRPALAVGAPTTIGLLLGSVTLSYLNSVAAGYSADHLAAIGVVLRLYLLGVLVVTGFCMGSQGLLGYTAGRGDQPRLRSVVRVLTLYVLGVAALLSALAWAFPGPVAALFAAPGPVRALIAAALPVVFSGLPALGLVIVATTLFQAEGRPRPALGTTLLRNGILLVPAITAATALYGASGIATGQLVSDLAAGLVGAVILARRGGPTTRR
ncbi:MATE family efflux transporter [Actinokineospora sp. NBRC 105648]|uniref:MATE family efflux transporter n=1 Tax=Actinokineospora sp. NBRC 105648 TaxID=3032206 RepID=UPI00249FD06B|nr:MATE family efflux transporter [Actinokineospora sp. NBRC 105648]GLZ37104.1 MATE family efflux transporter [Actinokineospora sp. NBRC 105648]